MSDRYIVVSMRSVDDETFTSLRAAEDSAKDEVLKSGSGRVVARVESVLMPGYPITLDEFQTEREFVQAEQRLATQRGGRLQDEATAERSR